MTRRPEVGPGWRNNAKTLTSRPPAFGTTGRTLPRSPSGRFNVPSVLDLQDWFFNEGIVKTKFPAERLIDTQYAEYAEKTLPPFEVTNKSDQLKGCR